jgi:transposase
MSKTGRQDKKQEQPFSGVVHPNAAGIDLGSREHWVAVPATAAEKPIQRFGTTTPQLQKLTAWLKGCGVDTVAMESTGVLWVPLYEILEAAGLEVYLVNARHLKSVPGRKTDCVDCQWLQQLHSFGLLKGAFRPTEEVCMLRTLQRDKSTLIDDAARKVQHMQKALQQMNVLVHHAVTDITGVTGMAIIEAILSGQRDPEKLAELRDRRCMKSKEFIAEALSGNFREDHLFSLAQAYQGYQALREQIAAYEREIQKYLKRMEQKADPDQNPLPPHPNKAKEREMNKKAQQPLRHMLHAWCGQDLTLIDGISAPTAEVLLSELGCDLGAFPTEKHFVSYIGLAPHTPISGGKRLRKRRKSMTATRASQALRMSASSLKRSKTALGAYFRRMSRKHSFGVAVSATARKLATLVYRMLTEGQQYVDQGMESYEEHFKQRKINTLERMAKELGMTLEKAQQPTPEAAAA